MHTLYTLGYTGTKPEHILSAAQQLGALVVDCRYSPRSRAVQWTGAGFRRLLGERYLHLPSLGNLNYKGDGPILINKPAEGVPQVQKLLQTQPVILLCVCKEFCTCHRTVVADLIKTACGCEIIHLSALDIMPPVPPVGQLFSGDLSAKSIPQPTDQGGTLILKTQALPLHQMKMF